MLILVMMMVVHLGTMLDIQELIDQWKTVVVTLAGMLGILVVILTVGTVILGKETAAVAAPPLTGGFVAAMMMQSVAPTEHLAILAMAVYVLQGFVGYPLTSICLKKEGYSVLKQYRQGTWKAAAVKEKANDDLQRTICSHRSRTNTRVTLPTCSPWSSLPLCPVTLTNSAAVTSQNLCGL